MTVYDQSEPERQHWFDPEELRREADRLEQAGWKLRAQRLRDWADWYEGTGPRPLRFVEPSW